MSIKNPKIFGLDVNQYFADILDKDEALKSLGVSPLDLSVIYGSSDQGVDTEDWRSFSNLNTPIWKELDRYSGDAAQHESLLNSRAGIDSMLFGDLDINGVLSGGAIRYRYLKGTGTTASIGLADISTSRVSAWSSSDPRANSNNLNIQRLAKISYGSRIKISYRDDQVDANTQERIGRGVLRFGEQKSSQTLPAETDGDNGNSNSQASGRRLQTTLTPQPKEFNSEIPTCKIKINLDGETRYLYAMKGIPLAFRGKFRSLDNIKCTVDTIQSNGVVIKPSWKVVKTNDRNSYSNYADLFEIGSYRSSRTSERFIELYYPADKITSITMTSANIEDLPVAKFESLTLFQLNSNSIFNFPNFNDITPKLEVLDISNNPLDKSETRSERVFSQELTNKMPTTMKQIYIGGTLKGSIERNIFADRFPELTYLSIVSKGGYSFYRDDNDKFLDTDNNIQSTATLPNIPIGITNFNAYSNNFRRLDATGTNDTETASFIFIGSYDSGNTVIYNCQANTGFLHQLAPGAVLNGAGIQPNTRVLRIKGTVVTVDKTFTSTQGNANITVDAQTNDDTRKVYRDGLWVDKNDTFLDANNTTQNYKVSGRYSIMNAPNLEYLNVYANHNLATDAGVTFRLDSIYLKEINMGHTKLAMPNIINREFLTEFNNAYNYTSNSFFVSENTSGTTDGKHTGYKLSGCNALKKIYCYGSHITGPFPNFGNNSELQEIDLRGTKMEGGGENIARDSQANVITSTTFAQCTNLHTFRFSSTTLARGNNTTDPIQDGIHQNAFVAPINLQTLSFHSNYQVSGRLPIFSTLSKLKNLTLDSNKFTGTIPTFNSNRKLEYIYLQNNELSGNIPALNDLTSLRRLYLHQNRRGSSTGFTGLSEFSGLNNLDIFYCHYNSIEGRIPKFGGCPKIRYIALYNNKFDSYDETSITSLNRLRYFDVSTNQLPASELEKILADALSNYNAAPRSGVTIDLRNNYINGNSDNNEPEQHTLIGEESQEIVIFLKTQAKWNIPGYN